MKHTKEEESEVLKHFHEEVPEETNIGSEVGHSESEGAQQRQTYLTGTLLTLLVITYMIPYTALK